MKRTVILLVAALCFCVTVTAQTNSPPQKPSAETLAKWKTAIEGVFRQRGELYKRMHSKKRKETIGPMHYAKFIGEVDTKECPKSFRIAWLKYVAAWEKLASDPKGIIPLVEIAVGTAHANVVMAAHGGEKLAKDAEQRKADAAATTQAIEVCKEIAIKYDAIFDGD